MVARMPNDYEIRLADAADIEQFAEIVNYYIENSAINFHDRPQSEEDWEANWEVLKDRYPFLVAVKDDVVGGPLGQSANQIADPTFGLALEHHVRVAKEVGACGRPRPSNRHWALESMGTYDEFLHRLCLNEETAREHDIGPFEVIVAEHVHVEVHQADIAVVWQQRCHCDQAKRREGCTFSDEAQPILEPPVCDGKAWVYE